MTRIHTAWHWWWALTWSHLHWYDRAALHLDAWFVLVADELALHVEHVNEYRDGCKLRPVARIEP
jgi:hypothetical protein